VNAKLSSYIREPVPERNELPMDFHARHRRVGSWVDGRCRVCYPPMETKETK
jgi:hypothetical protein